MANVALAGPELARRLASFVQRNGRVLVIRNHRFGLTVNGEEIIPPSTDFMITAMPANAPWAVRCKKEGLSIAFGPSIFGEVSEGSGDIGPEAVVALTNVPLSDQQCTDLVPAVADALLSIAFP